MLTLPNPTEISWRYSRFWVSKAVGKAWLLLVKQKRPMSRAFTASISQGISNESELTLVFKSKIWLWLSNASYI